MRWLKGPLYFLVGVITFVTACYVTMDILLTRGEDVICPDVRGKTVDEAKRLAEAKGLSLIVSRWERRADVPYNHITVQKPEAHMPTRLGRVIAVIASEGPPLVEVPGLIGRTLSDCEELLREKPIRIEKTIRVPSLKDGRVVAQIPSGGEKIVEGKGLVLFVGVTRRGYYLMPDLKEANATELVEEMESKGIKYRVANVRADQLQPGESVRASVPGRAIFSSGDEIELKVNMGGRHE
jgi:beta-lactam-binding protein with PASTA domain